jgi:hypothetical protein
MPVQVSYPGVYIQEVPSGVQTITGVSTSVAMFVGTARRGRLGVAGSTPRFFPQRVRSFTDYERLFGADTDSETTDQVRQFFLNGGREAWVTRISDAAAAAAAVQLDNEDGATVLTLTAKDAGADGNLIRAEVDYDTVDPEATFNLRVFRLEADAFGELQIIADETFTELSMDAAGGRYVETVVNQQSVLVDAAVDGGAPAPGEGFSLSGILLDGGAVDDTAAVGTLNGQISGTANSITISVDGRAFVPAVLPTIDGAGAALPAIAEWETAINMALNPTGTAVDVALVAGPGTTRYLEIRSRNATGGAVVVRPGAVNDASAALELGTAQGGLEVSGFAPLRPAATGFFARLGGPNLTAFNNLAAATDADIGDWELTDGTSASPHSATPVFEVAGGQLFEGTASSLGEGSLLNVRQNLRNLADSINANVSNEWRATVEGVRIVLRPRIGGQLRPRVDAVNAGVNATMGSDGAALDIGADGEYFDSAGGVTSANAAAYSLGTTGLGNYQGGGANGAPGGVPSGGDYDEAYAIIDAEVDIFNLLMLPRAAGQTDPQRDALWGPASTFCQRRRAFLLVDPRSSWMSADDVDSEITQVRIGLVADHAAIYWPRVSVANNGGTRSIDPAGSIAGLMARIDGNRGVWKAPAGIEAGLRGVRGVEHMMTDEENGTINLQAVNAIRSFPSGIVSWGARTVVGHRSDDYRYVPVRRIALFMEESLYRGLRFAVFEPNDEPLWAQIRLAAGAFMNNLFRQGAFQGQKASDAYFVKVDSETTTQNDINLGVVNVVVGFAPLRPAEFVVVTIQQMAGQIQV